MTIYKVLLFCKDNSILSLMAEGYLRQFKGDNVEVYSAGITIEMPDPEMLHVMQEDGVVMSGVRQNKVSDLKHIDFDYIISFDSESENESKQFPSRSVKYHYSFDQFIEMDNIETKTEVLINIRNRMKKIIRAFVKEYFTGTRTN